MEILHRDDLHLGGFAGLREHRLVTDKRLFGENTDPDTWAGLGNFVYLADARFLPKGETKMHSRREIDVISVMVEGSIAHEGSLEHGQEMKSTDAQSQRAGGEGFSHNEINPDDTENRMIQLWVLPERVGDPASYKFFQPKSGEVTRIYGGAIGQNDTHDSYTLIDIGLLKSGQNETINGSFYAYLTRGSGFLNGKLIVDGDLVRGDNLVFKATEDAQIILIHTRQ